MMYNTHFNGVVRIRHHGNEHVEHDDDRHTVEAANQHGAKELCQVVLIHLNGNIIIINK